MRASRETWLLLAIGLADLISTTYLIRAGLVREGNPVMAWYLVHYGWAAFCAAKTVMLFCPVVILEWVRRIKPQLGLRSLRVALIGYLLLYLGALLPANRESIQYITHPHLYRVKRFIQQRPKPLPPGSQLGKPMVMPVHEELTCH